MAQREPVHLRPTAQLAERVLLPGDPGRALALAQALLEKPLMFNHHRGLWGYTGTAADGEPLSIQSTGMGGPSAAIVFQELIALGVRRAIRVGTCGALDGALVLGDLLLAREALVADGTSRALGAGERVAADRELTAALERAASTAAAPSTETDSSSHLAGATAATVVSTDLFYEPSGDRECEWLAAGALAVEMEAAALFAVGAQAGVPVACALTVSDAFPSDPGIAAERLTGRTVTGRGGAQRVRIDDDLLAAAAERMGRVAIAALSA
jgi:DeoD family purine-nucleoside phosphorylase